MLQPRLVSDPNRNQTEVAFDMLGMVVGTAVMGKPLPAPRGRRLADRLRGRLTQAADRRLLSTPPIRTPARQACSRMRRPASSTISTASGARGRPTRSDPTRWQPACAATLARETHASDPVPAQGRKIQLSFSYSDGFGREIQKKIQAEPGPLVDGGTVINPRWVGSGWTIFNNKGKPVRQYEPFFSATHRFEFGVQRRRQPGPVLRPGRACRRHAAPEPHLREGRVRPVAADHLRRQRHRARSSERSDRRPAHRPRHRGATSRPYFDLARRPASPWETGRATHGGALGPHEQAAAAKAAAHADTPTTVHLDALGRPFLTVARNRVVCAGHPLDGTEESSPPASSSTSKAISGRCATRVDAGRRPARRRIVMRYAYDMLGNRLHQLSMEAGARWMLNDVAGKTIRAWDSRGHNFTTRLRRAAPAGEQIAFAARPPTPIRAR